MSTTLTNSCLRLFIKPLMRLCLRHNVKIQEIIESCKLELLEVAKESLVKDNRETTVSRLSIMTGLQRRDVLRLQGLKSIPNDQSLVSKVLGLWVSSRRYKNSEANIRRLKHEEFYSLVAQVSKDLNPRTVLDELIRIEAVSLKGEEIEVVRTSYIPKGNIESGFKIAAHDLEGLIRAVDENLNGQSDLPYPHHHLRTEFDRIKTSALPEIKRWLLLQGKEFHLRSREYLAQFDQDINPDEDTLDNSSRVSITSFAFSEPHGDTK